VRGGLVVFTDLDATLLDEETHAHEAAGPALQELRRAGASLILCTGRTRAEVEPLHRELGLTTPFVFENGGGIVIPVRARGWRAPLKVRGGGPLVIPLGTRHAALVAALREISSETGWRLVGFWDLTIEEVADRTGLSREAARLAATREFDEPFLIEGPDPEAAEAARIAVAGAAERRGLRLTSGGRFHHLTGPVDKGRAVRQLLGLHEGPVFSLALGDSANDLTMLQAVDQPVIVPRPDGSWSETLLGGLPNARRAPFPGPRGWNETVLAELREIRRSTEEGETTAW
jgi:mannosyl-3-phosphoglycerate phosphatase